ncbi:MAG: hypothetical protein L0I24_19970, partial [Pseudonocardia sp.]|nr:hypothetical protein [Pseudonocardia sp.]
TGTVGTTDVLGTASVGDRSWPYSAATAVPPSGLYEGRADVRGAVARIGWILLPDGTQVGVRDVGGLLSPAPPLDVGDATTIDATTIDATTIDGVPVDVRPVTGRTA